MIYLNDKNSSSALFNLPHAQGSVSCLAKQVILKLDLLNLLAKWYVFRKPEGKKSTREAYCCLLHAVLELVTRTSHKKQQGAVFRNLFPIKMNSDLWQYSDPCPNPCSMAHAFSLVYLPFVAVSLSKKQPRGVTEYGRNKLQAQRKKWHETGDCINMSLTHHLFNISTEVQHELKEVMTTQKSCCAPMESLACD